MTMLNDSDVLVSHGSVVKWELLAINGGLGTWRYVSSIENDPAHGTIFTDVLPARAENASPWAIGDHHYPMVTERKRKADRKRKDSAGMTKAEREKARDAEREIRYQNSLKAAQERAVLRAARQWERYHAALERVAQRAKNDEKEGRFVPGAIYSVAILSVRPNGNLDQVVRYAHEHIGQRMIVRYLDGDGVLNYYNPLRYSDKWYYPTRRPWRYGSYRRYSYHADPLQYQRYNAVSVDRFTRRDQHCYPAI